MALVGSISSHAAVQDLFASKCEDEQEISAANSASVNKAYQTLVEPMSRVRYLVSCAWFSPPFLL